MRGTRPYRHISACLLSYVPGWPVPTACDHNQGWHSPTGSRMQQVLSSLDVPVVGHGLSGHTANSTAPPGANVSDVQVGIHVDLCHFLKRKKKSSPYGPILLRDIPEAGCRTQNHNIPRIQKGHSFSRQGPSQDLLQTLCTNCTSRHPRRTKA